MPTILLTNDDGIRSAGLLALKRQLETLGEVFVVAPKEERSGIGKAISTGHIEVNKTVLEDDSEAYAVNGTPADAFLIATFKLLKHPPDIVVSGINLGPNLGIDDLLTSGTIGAALEAAIHGVPAVAVSYCMERITGHNQKNMPRNPKDLEIAAKITRKVVEYVLANGMPPDVDVISINVPQNASEEIEITRLSYKGYHDIFTQQGNGYVIKSWILTDYPEDKPGTDLHAIKRDKRISITPIKLQLAHNAESLDNLLRFLNQTKNK
ncbi:MAG: 5'/3'-nucleotidase SurE [Candidatus Bathyarchaeia archaeon]